MSSFGILKHRDSNNYVSRLPVDSQLKLELKIFFALNGIQI
jgi:hypothetical protein